MQQWHLPQKSNNKIAFVNARIIDPETNFDTIGEIICEGGKIVDFGRDLVKADYHHKFDEVIECNGNILMPGIIDIHVHLRDPGQTHKEDIQSGTKSAVAGGVTTVVCQPNTTPAIDNVQTLEYIQQKAKKLAYANVLSYASVTKGGKSLSDMQALKKAGAVGFTDDGLPVMNPLLMQKAFVWAAKLGLPVAQHAEDIFLSDGGCINKGRVSAELNLPGISDISESVMVARDIMLLENTMAHYHVLHVSTKKSVQSIAQAKQSGLNVTCEVTPHHFLLNEEEVLKHSSLAKMNPPLRTEEDRICMIEALKNDVIDVIASDHAPHDRDSKDTSITNAAFGIVGLETILPLSLELYHEGLIDLCHLLAKLTCNPAKIIGSDAGRIKVGAPADLIVLDINHQWQIKAQKFASKSKNSPFNNRNVKGKVVYTIVGGSVVFKDSELIE